MLIVMMLSASPSCSRATILLGHGYEEEHEMTDEDRALNARERGEVLPLEQVMARLDGHIPGEISGIELEKENGIWVYEFKVISPQGQMLEVHIDAKTGKLVDRKGD
jgi:uncharacterized membrane protein YkoI